MIFDLFRLLEKSFLKFFLNILYTFNLYIYNKIYKIYICVAGPIPLRVREAEIPVVSDAECIRKVNAVTEKIFILPASSFCAGGEQGNDACQVICYVSIDNDIEIEIYI